jgi:hypothetical protein
VTLAGPLLSATNNATLSTGNFVFFYVGDGARVTSTSAAPLLAFDDASVTATTNIMSVNRSVAVVIPSTLTLAGPLFSAVNGSSFNCCGSFHVSQGAQLISTTTDPLIQLANSSFQVPPGYGGFFFLADTFSTAAAGTLVAPASVTLSGPLLSVTGGSLGVAEFNLLEIVRSSFTSSSPAPLIDLSGTSVTLGSANTVGDLVLLVSSANAGTIGSPASLTLTGTGSLLSATNSNVSLSGDVVGVFNGATLSSLANAPLIQLTGGTLTTAPPAGNNNGFALNVGGLGGQAGNGLATVTLGGPLLAAAGGANGQLDLAGGLVNVSGGGTVMVNDAVNGVAPPLTSITGGASSIGTNPAAGANPAMFRLAGTSTAQDAQSGLTLGTDRPLQGPQQPDGTRPVPGSLLQTNGATVTGQRLVNVDTALLEATAPLLNAINGSALTTALAAVNLANRGNVLTSPGTDLVNLSASQLVVSSGALVNVNASKLTVGGNLVTLANGATLNFLNGPLISVSGNGYVNIMGSLVNFAGTGGNQVNVTNNLCSPSCTVIGGIPVALQNNANANNVSITNPINNTALGKVNLSPNAALAVVNGAGSKLTVAGGNH